MKKKNSFVLYASQAEAIKDLSLTQKGQLLDALFEYADNGEFPDIQDGFVKIAFRFISQQISIDTQRYEEACEKKREAIKRRWAQQKNAPISEGKKDDSSRYTSIDNNTYLYNAIHNDNDNGNGNDNDTKSTDVDYDVKKEKEIKRNVFVKPKIEDVDAYIRERGYHFDAETFYNFYESKGWMVGSNHMKDWKAACRTWEAKRKNEAKPSSDDEAAVQEFPAGLTQEKWNATMTWAKRHIPRIWDKFSPSEFLSMKAMAQHKSSVFTEIICAIDKSDYTGDITKEFRRLACEEPYVSKILGNG